jgi:hypothetical protein
MSESFRKLPSGKVTKDLNNYLPSWKRISNPLIKATGWKLLGFDPGYLFDVPIPGTNKCESVSLSVNMVKSLIKNLKNNSVK